MSKRTYSFILGIVHHNQLKISSKHQQIYLWKVRFYAFWQPYWIFGRHLAFEAKSEVTQERFSNSVVWGTWIRWESLDRKNGSFYLAWTWLFVSDSDGRQLRSANTPTCEVPRTGNCFGDRSLSGTPSHQHLGRLWCQFWLFQATFKDSLV